MMFPDLYICSHIKGSFWLAAGVYQGAVVLIVSPVEKFDGYCRFCLMQDGLCVVLLGT